MQLIIISIIALAVGAALGYLFHKSKSQQLVTEKELLAKEVETLKAQQQNFDKFREESLQSAKAVMFETSREISAKLLEDHKRENLESRKNAEEVTKKETEALHKEFAKVTQLLAAVQGQSQLQEKKLSAVWQSLTSPVKASNFAEIGLENTLKNFGFEPGVDFDMQAQIDGSRLRPDAIIKLPAGNVILIDAKTSKYFLEIAAAENDDAERLKEKLKSSMQTHLSQLSARDYVGAYKAKSENIVVVNVMYLPNDAAYSRVLECDADFDRKCRDARVLLVTPASLNMLLAIAQHQITREKSEQNHQEIRKVMGQVISSVDVLLRNFNEVGRAIQKTAVEYSKLSTPMNRLIPRIKKAVNLGLEPENALKLPEALPNFNVVENQPVMIEAETPENVDEPKVLGIRAKA